MWGAVNVNKYIVYENAVCHGYQCAESMKEAIRFICMMLFAQGVAIGDDGWYARQVA